MAVLLVAAIIGIIFAIVSFNYWYVEHRLKAQGYHVEEVNMAWINRHPFWCASNGKNDTVNLYTFRYLDQGQEKVGFACEHGWWVQAWPTTDFSLIG